MTNDSRDDEIAYLKARIEDCRRDLKAAIDAQSRIGSAPSFDQYLAKLRQLDADYAGYSARLEKLTGIKHPKRLKTDG